MCLYTDGEAKKSKFVDHREFQGWYCSVNWFFMHIEQQTDSVFHHQTCQALYGNKRGPVGFLKNADQLIADLEIRLASDNHIICPNDRCGCGMCVPKAKDLDIFKEIKSDLLVK
jgi:hypothetical protein